MIEFAIFWYSLGLLAAIVYAAMRHVSGRKFNLMEVQFYLTLMIFGPISCLLMILAYGYQCTYEDLTHD